MCGWWAPSPAAEGIDVQPDVEPRLAWAWMTEADLADVAALREATDYFDDPIERVDLAALRDLWDAPGAEPTRNAAVGRDRTGSLVAYAWGHPRRGEGELRYWLDWDVHPAWRHRHIGTSCVAWLKERGLEWWQRCRDLGEPDPFWMGAYVDEKLGTRLTAVRASGFVPGRWMCDMKVLFVDSDPDLLSAQTPEGVRLVPFTDDLSERVRRAHNAAFSTVPGAHRVSAEVWRHTLQVTTMRPDWSWVALADDDVVGYAISSGYTAGWEAQGYTEGWTEFLGTVPEWRGRGIARAVLTRALRAFKSAGLAGAGLGVDADRDDAAHHLFLELGYRPAERLVLVEWRAPAPQTTADRIAGPSIA